MVEEDEFEEFDEDLENPTEEEETIDVTPPVQVRRPVVKAQAQVPVRKPQPAKVPASIAKVPEEQVKEEPVPEYVAIPRVVSTEAMLNEIYDGQQEIKQILRAILTKIK